MIPLKEIWFFGAVLLGGWLLILGSINSVVDFIRKANAHFSGKKYSGDLMSWKGYGALYLFMIALCCLITLGYGIYYTGKAIYKVNTHYPAEINVKTMKAPMTIKNCNIEIGSWLIDREVD